MVALHELMTDAEVVAALNAHGCKITLDTYKAFVLAVNTVPHQGTEKVADVIDPVTKKALPVHQDLPYKPEDVAAQRLLRSSIERKFNLVHGANAWVD